MSVKFLLILVIILVLALLTRSLVGKSKKPSKPSAPPARRSSSSAPRVSGRSLQDCISAEDIPARIDAASRQLEKKVQDSKALVEQARRKGYLTVSTAWMNRFNDLVQVSHTLDENLRLENERRLTIDRFHRYTDLHFRSMIMGDLAYQDYSQAKEGRDQLGTLLVEIGRGHVKVSRAEKDNYYQLKDAFKESAAFLHERMSSINRRTAHLRDKIGAECGERGQRWYQERMRGRR